MGVRRLFSRVGQNFPGGRDEGQICRLHRVTESVATSEKKSNHCSVVCQKIAAGVGFTKIQPPATITEKVCIPGKKYKNITTVFLNYE